MGEKTLMNVIDIVPRLRAKREDELLEQKAELIAEYLYGKDPIEVRQKHFDMIDEVDRQLEALS